MIEVVIFDLGGVLIRSGERPARRKWETRLQMQEWELDDLVFNSEMGLRAQRGQISDEELWRWVSEQLALPPRDFQLLHWDFWSDNKVDPEMLDLIHALGPAYRTAVISNATATLREDLQHRYGIIDAFDLVVCSAEERIMKPEAEIFVRAVNRLQVEPNQCVFIDDMEINVTAARELGIGAIHFTPATDLEAELRIFGVVKGG